MPLMLSYDVIDNINLRARQMCLHNKESALGLAEQACKLAVQIEYHLGYAQGLLNHARALARDPFFEESIALMRHSLMLGEEHALHAHIVDSLLEIAAAYYCQCEYDLALQYWSYCLDLSLNLSDDHAYIQAQIGLGQIYYAHDDFAAALEHHKQAAEFVSKINNDQLCALLYINLGGDYLSLLEYDEALTFLQQGLFYAKKASHLEYVSEALCLIGQVQWGLGKYQIARRNLLAALKLNLQLENQWGMAANYLALGKISLARRDVQSAEAYLAQGLLHATLRSAANLIFQFELLMADLAELKGDFKLALAYFKRFHHGQQAVKSQLSPHKLQAMKMQLEIESARLENADLRRQRASQHKEIQRVERLASYDGLTGILNRRGLEEQGSELFQRQRQNQQSLSVLMIDVDHFKKVNDGCGHPVGDKVLRQIAALLKSGCRQDDLVGRYGGEEFVVLLPNHEGVAATEVGERLRSLVDAWIWSRIHPELNITISVGIASIVDDPSLEALLSRSDQCLYQAKQQGRNRVVV
ncbi:diguanylate cyclase [Iodobacter sp. HSC-16F04]|uniref:diguanylate cyclase n=1 Tax=Iodobacter violaceini TaxID=3044271 RepID=A0ABX0KNF2_9NEIS|nr:tetratricopeptide repeat-containing diguanylate cyclase [Iodobacter violacea]NHQ85795.1 diguanylate cyclase [Iodobacter violacea]